MALPAFLPISNPSPHSGSQIRASALHSPQLSGCCNPHLKTSVLRPVGLIDDLITEQKSMALPAPLPTSRPSRHGCSQIRISTLHSPWLWDGWALIWNHLHKSRLIVVVLLPLILLQNSYPWHCQHFSTLAAHVLSNEGFNIWALIWNLF